MGAMYGAPPPPHWPPRPAGTPPTPGRVRGARVVAVIILSANVACGLVVLVLAGVLFFFALLGIMWGSACRGVGVADLGLICSRRSWPALAVAGGGVAITVVLQAVTYPMLWRRSTLLVPAVVGLAITTATAAVAWALAQSGLA